MSVPTPRAPRAPSAALPEALAVLGVVAGSTIGAVTLGWPPRDTASSEECQEILRRYAEARIRQADESAPPETVASHRAAAERRAAASRRFARCPREVGQTQAECALRASGADEIERCLQ